MVLLTWYLYFEWCANFAARVIVNEICLALSLRRTDILSCMQFVLHAGLFGVFFLEFCSCSTMAEQ